MKRSFLSIGILLSALTTAFSQYQIGFQVSPILTYNRLELENNLLGADEDGSGLNIALGPIVDIRLTDNYYFSSGVFFASKKARVAVADTLGNSLEEAHRIQYLQVPVSLKLFTNEFSLDKKIFFQFGGIAEVNINEKVEAGSEALLIEEVQFFDFSVMAGAGVEYKMGVNTIVYGGLSYHRGLVNAVSANNDLYGKAVLKNDYIALNLGIKF